MKLFLALLSFPFIVLGASVHTEITFSGEPMPSIRTITQAFNKVGYKFDIEALRVYSGYGELVGTATGNKVFNPPVFSENLKEQGILIERAHLNDKGLILSLNTQNSVWNVPLIGSDEGTEIKKVNSAQWFRVESGQQIRMEPPYSVKWYPDVAVLDTSMRVLISLRSLEAKEELQFELPQGSYYLKVSNTQGMKVLKEGMWVESMSMGR